MGCLFGFCGCPNEGLLDKMADALRHRCKNGIEKVRLNVRDGHVVEIGHGIAPWTGTSQVAEISHRRLALGYCGVFFNQTADPGENISFAKSLLSKIGAAPGRYLPLLEGAFAASVASEKDLYLIRDPAGIKALYWACHKDRIVFASEIKALFADDSVSRRLRVGALPEYLTFSFVPGERTMFENIFELQPGTMLKYRNGYTSVSRHFQFENRETTEKVPKHERDYTQRVRSDLEQSVAECCAVNNGNPPAVFLSGGIDSSAVLAVTANRFPDQTVKTFSVHFGPKYANENQFVSLMVDRYQTDHTWLEIQPKRFIKRMRQIIWQLDDPIGDPITVPNYLLSEAAARATRVILNGEGGDPCFGGPKNIPMLLARMYGPRPGEPDAAWMERNYLFSYKKCFSDLKQILNPDVLKEYGGEKQLTDIIFPFFNTSRPRSFLNKLMAMNIRLKGANLILVKVDKMSSANGILALAPLFSKRIIETSMYCPPGLKLRGSIEKSVLKQAVSDIVPLPIVMRPKSGMMVPVRFWLRGEMKRYARKVLSRKNIERLGFFNYAYVKNLLNYDKREIQSARYGLKLWMLMTFMFWYEQMIEAPGSDLHA